MSEENKQPKGIEMPEGNPFANLTFEEEDKTLVKSTNPMDPFDFRVTVPQLVKSMEEMLKVMEVLEVKLANKPNEWEQLVGQLKIFGIRPEED